MAVHGHKVTVSLDDNDAAMLAEEAGRINADENDFVSELVVEALHARSISGEEMASILDSIPGAFESHQRGKADFAAGRSTPIDEVEFK